MLVMNKRMNIPAMQKILQNFGIQSEMMDMKEEMMGETMDDMFNEGDEEEESEDLVNQVLDELRIDLSTGVSPWLSCLRREERKSRCLL